MMKTRSLTGACVVITRPAGTGGTLAREVRARGGTPLLLPGASLRGPAAGTAARAALRQALACDLAIFTSPAAVRFAQRLDALQGRARLLAPGTGTLRALVRAGCRGVGAPTREDSEGLLGLPSLQDAKGMRIGIIGAAGGRGLLDRELAARGAETLHAHVYQRQPARLDRRHADRLLHARQPVYVLLSSSEALTNILASLPAAARVALLRATAVTSSARLADAARKAGFARLLDAGSAHADAMLEAIGRDRD
ncbi:MAG: uroporphyrinogen-III synthase [Rhodanobacteraceae bacterium]|nr:MAG: uroporphyrinogen-III synthase [Rhodanobacteraceae bacterium]